ncbi:uncharacterized protein TRUGW13939_09280 [Talaromyces rugulosus]|uniref:Xylanolytic transcriptional activator regulatory domain-containing protein n=1 Tax=Talaromyces rugulosus TaxID=121627 RepID=A0A7H8R6X3_TALRU|nr:uncharacterized protein TRUGW13939_09280 [Talaromyces rugulosus]QKX62124.1 hypothetical protein TRUGW13939_09280 [Talaromyces rugulosus]
MSKETEADAQTVSSSSSLSSIGSLEAIDVVEEDLNRNTESRATGYMGKNSEVSWLHRLDEAENSKERGESDKHSQTAAKGKAAEGLSTFSLSSFSYHLDNVHLSHIGESSTEPFLLPAKEVAEKLLQVYLESVQTFFPIIRKQLFVQQFENLYSRSAGHPGERWLAILNLIFAISSNYWRLTQPNLPQELHSEVFFSRAKALSIGENVIYEHADLQQVQAESLMAFYFLSSGQINRGWKMIGIASRSGISLGLHLRNTSRIELSSTKTRCRVWWSIFYLEHRLSVITSRPSCIPDNTSSVYPPVPVEEKDYDLPHIRLLLEDHRYRERHLHWTLGRNDTSSTRQQLLHSAGLSSAVYFFHQTDLAKITHAITNGVYNIDVLMHGWERIAGRIDLYSAKLDDWLSSLVPPLRFTDERRRKFPSLTNSYQISLALHFYSTRIVLGRPCLTRPGTDTDTGIIYPRSGFDNDISLICLQSALDLISIFPDEPNPVWLFKSTPWWCVLHFIMQSVSVLLVHLSIGPVNMRTNNDKEVSGEGASGEEESPEIVLKAIKKICSWLHSLSEYDHSAQRAFDICNKMFHRVASSQGFTTGEIVSETVSNENLERPGPGRFDRQAGMSKEERDSGPDSGAYGQFSFESYDPLADLGLGIDLDISPMLDINYEL